MSMPQKVWGNGAYLPRGCEVCGKPYVSTKNIQRTCSRKCRDLGYWIGKSQPLVLSQCSECGKWIKPSRKYCSKDCAKVAASRQAKARYRVSGHVSQARTHWLSCVECGESKQVPLARRRYCSEKCARRSGRRMAKHVRRVRERAAGVRTPTFTTRQVAERDDYRCHLCKRKVRETHWSLDHLVPLCDGGQHTLDNVALAHWLCNSLRRDTGTAQLLLLGK